MLKHSGAIDAAAVIGRLNVSLLHALLNFKQELIEQVKLDTIAQHRLLKETLIEELQPLEQGFIELRQSIKKTLIEQRQSLRGRLFKKTFIEQRQSPREGVELTAWIDIGNSAALRDCNVLIADDGARIRMAYQAELPNEFDLLLDKNGPRERCRLLWRSDEEVGIAYLGPRAGACKEPVRFTFQAQAPQAAFIPQ